MRSGGKSGSTGTKAAPALMIAMITAIISTLWSITTPTRAGMNDGKRDMSVSTIRSSPE